MCPDTEDLLSLMEGAAPDAVASHVRECATCGRELSLLRAQRDALRALPEVPAPPPPVALLRRSHSSPMRWLALAATVAAVGVLGVWLTLSPAPAPAPHEMVVEVVPEAVPRAVLQQMEEIKTLTRRSALLERQWQRLNRRAPRVRRVAHEATTAPLKSGLMQLDAAYAQLPESEYWRQRVQLLDTLVTLEHTEQLVRNDARLGVRPALMRTL